MKRRVPVILSALALSLATVAALPAQAAKPEPISAATYTALGDSYAAGFGAGTPNVMGQTAEAYPVLLAGGAGFNFLAVGSAGTTATVKDQIAVGLLPRTTKQVTLTVGGNDLGFVAKVTGCLMSGVCAALAPDELAELTADLSGDIAAVHKLAPSAKIYVTGYPLLFQAAQTPGDNGWCVVSATTSVQPIPIMEAQADALDAAAVALNRAIRAATEDPTGYAKYVDVTAAFTGHGLCAPSPTYPAHNPVSYINPVNVTGTGIDLLAGPLHPNAAGQQAYAASILAKGFKN